MTTPPTTSTKEEEPLRICPGCGGRNLPDALECDWCGHLFTSNGQRLRLAGWQLASTVLILALVAAVVALGVLNAGRPVGAARSTPVAAIPTAFPTPIVTPRVRDEPTPTPRSVATGTPFTQIVAAVAPTPTPEPVEQARVANTSGLGVMIRREPGPKSPAVGTLREGATVELTGEEQPVAARLWREVVVPERSLRGWILSDYLQPVP